MEGQKPKLFIHIPKNGGMTIRHANNVIGVNEKRLPNPYIHLLKYHFCDPNMGHARWRDLKRGVQERFQTFAIVRNPWSRTVSRFTFGKLKKIIPENHSFKKFLEQRLELGDKEFYWHRATKGWYQQKDYVTSETDEVMCDLFRFEHFSDILSYLDIDEPVRIHKVSNGTRANNETTIIDRKDYREFYDEESKQIIADWYEADIKFFGFTFDGTATKNVNLGVGTSVERMFEKLQPTRSQTP